VARQGRAVILIDVHIHRVEFYAETPPTTALVLKVSLRLSRACLGRSSFSHSLSNELRKFKQKVVGGGGLARTKPFLLTCPCDARCGLHRLHEQRRQRERLERMPRVLVLHIHPVTREPRHLPMRLPVKPKCKQEGTTSSSFLLWWVCP